MSEENKIAYDLSFFMPEKVVPTEETKAPISKRIVDADGNVVPFIFKPISTERVDELEKMNTKPLMQKGKRVGDKVDHPRFMAQLAVESTVYPNFKSKEMREAYKSEDPVDVAKKVLTVPGEYASWIAKAAEVNGFDDSIEDLEEEVKN